MTDPREQAIEARTAHDQAVDAVAEAFFQSKDCTCNICRASLAINTYLAARARLDGAKMMPREATGEMQVAGALVNSTCSTVMCASIYRAMHDATPKEGT